VKNIEVTISANGRYNQAETALIVDLETQINQLQSYNNGSLSSIICYTHVNKQIDTRHFDIQ